MNFNYLSCTYSYQSNQDKNRDKMFRSKSSNTHSYKGKIPSGTIKDAMAQYEHFFKKNRNQSKKV